MRPYRRQPHGHSGRSSRPPGHSYRPLEHQGHDDPEYIAYLRHRAAHYSDRLAALSIDPPMPPSTSYAGLYSSTYRNHPSTTHPNITPSPSSTQTRRRNTSKEGSKHPFYAVRNGLEGNEIYTSWRAAAPHCWNSETNYFFDDCVCKGFPTYDDAADWLLETMDPDPLDDLPPEPPTVPPPPPSHSSTASAATTMEENQPSKTSDVASIPTADYERFLNDKWLTEVIPSQVSVKSTATANSADDANATLPFLNSTSSKAIPTYSGKTSEDVNEFLFKLKIFLQHPSIANCHKQANTTPANAHQSKNLATLLGLCISGDVLSPFIDNPMFEDKGIEMVHHLISMKHPSSQASASAVYNNMYSTKIRKHETFEAFAKRLRTQYRTCTRSGFPYEESYLVRCFINGLDSNFDHARTLLQNGALNWYSYSLNDVIQEVTEVKLNRQSSGAWTTDDGAANLVGKQGAKRPDQSTPPSSNTIVMDPDVPAYCYKASNLTIKEVQHLMRRYSCPLCRRNGHPLHECLSLARVYNITLKPTSPQPTRTSFRPSTPNTQSSATTTATANRVSTLPTTVEDSAERYVGFENVLSPPSPSSTASQDQSNSSTNKISEQSTPYPHLNFRFHYKLASACQTSIQSHKPIISTATGNINTYPIIIDSGATHHM